MIQKKDNRALGLCLREFVKIKRASEFYLAAFCLISVQRVLHEANVTSALTCHFGNNLIMFSWLSHTSFISLIKRTVHCLFAERKRCEARSSGNELTISQACGQYNILSYKRQHRSRYLLVTMSSGRHLNRAHARVPAAFA